MSERGPDGASRPSATKPTDEFCQDNGGPRFRRFERYAAIDLGTNNCRLLIAAPAGANFRIVDAFSKIVRLGEGLSKSGVLSEAAMERALGALTICAEKIERRRVTDMRCIATQACRGAANGDAFLAAVKERTGLEFDVIAPEEEARLAVRGCEALLDKNADAALIFDIGGGSTELSWVQPHQNGRAEIIAWTSLPFGVVTLAEESNGRDLTPSAYQAIVSRIEAEIDVIDVPLHLRGAFENGSAHFLRHLWHGDLFGRRSSQTQ